MANNDEVRVGGNSILVLASVGAGAFLVLLTILFFISPMSEISPGVEGHYFIQQIVMLVSFLLSSAFLPLITNSHIGGRRPSVHLGTLFQNDRVFDMLSILGIVLGFGFTVILIWFGDSLDAPTRDMLMYLACVLAGLAAALNARVWLLFYSRAFYQLSRLSVFWSICMAVTIAGVFGLADFGFDYLATSPSVAFCCAALAFASIFMGYYCKNDLSPIENADFLDHSTHWSERMSSLLKLARPFYVGFVLAITVHLLLAIEGISVTFAFFSCALLVGAAAYAIVTWFLKSFIPIPTIDRLVCGLICVCFAILPFAGRIANLVILAILLLACLFFFVQTWCTAIQMMTYWSYISMPDRRGILSFASVMGFFVGYALSACMRECARLPIDSFVAIACVSAVVLFVLLCTFIPYDNPVWDEFSNIINGIDSIPLDEELSSSCQEQNQETRCAYLAGEKGLTPREGEVLLLLARGRNAAVIARELVISPYTAKTHIYRIMRKFDVRSQQDLIDIIDGLREE